MSSQVELVKERSDIVEIIGERIKLQRSGQNFRALCPFHSEKSPSFFVNPQIQRYKCFGCQESGDVFTFLQKFDNLSFGESLELLAKRAGITLEDKTFTPEDKRRQRLFALLSLTKEYYHYLLTEHEAGEKARTYVKNRQTTKDTVDLFGIGYALPSWDGLQKYLIGKKGYTEQELLDAGLIIRSERGTYYDRFRDRLMFPLTTPQGQVVGFSARSLNPEEKQAKYINSPETTLYHKGDLLFGFSQLHRFIREQEQVILVEGEFDALSSFQAHVPIAVAIKGSALTPAQLKMLARNVKRILLSLDADMAGIEATKRAITLAKDHDVALRVIPLTGGKDPDEIAKTNPKAWREMVEQSVSVYDFLIDHSFLSHDADSGEGKREISKELAAMVAQIANAVEQTHYIQTIAKRLGVGEGIFGKEVQKVQTPQLERTQEEVHPKKHLTRREVLDQYLLSLLFHFPSSEFAKHFDEVTTKLQFSEIHERIIEVVKPKKTNFDVRSFHEVLPAELKGVFADLYMEYDEAIGQLNLREEYEDKLKELIKMSEQEKKISSQLSAVTIDS